MRTKKRGKAPSVGDVFEVRTPAGNGYVQLVNVDKDGIHLIRVLPGLFSRRPEQLASLVAGPERYFTFYVPSVALEQRWIELAGHYSVPKWALVWPVMRHPIHGRGTDILGWYIGSSAIPLTLEGYKQLRFVRELTPEEKKLPIRQMWSHGLLVENLVRNWTPQQAEELDAIARATEEARQAQHEPLESKREYIDHYLYFKKQSDAQEAAARLRAKGWFAEARRALGVQLWLTLAKQPAPIEEEIGDVRNELESLAEELHGEYDGWGAAI